MDPSCSDAPPPDLPSHPSDQELVKTYLTHRVLTGEHPWKFIHDADVYSADPADLTREYSPATASDGERAWYFFTSVRPKSSRGQRKARIVGSGEGCWHSESGARSVLAGIGRKIEIGRRQFFSFVKKEDGRRVRSGWIMVEVRLKHGQKEKKESYSDEVVLCKVYRSPRAGPARGAEGPAAVADEAEKSDGPAAVADGADKPEGSAPVAAGAEKSKKAAVAVSAEKSKGPAVAAGGGKNSMGAAPAAAARHKRKAGGKKSGAGRSVRLCTRCRIEIAESQSETADDAVEGVLEDDSVGNESAAPAPHGEGTGDSSDIHRHRATPFYKFV